MDPVAMFDLPSAQLHGDGKDSVRWQGAFVSSGGHGADQSTTIIFEIEPGARLSWHTDQTQYIVSGTGELRRDAGVFPGGRGSVLMLPTNVGHHLVNTGTETLRAVGFFSAAMFTRIFDNLMHPVKSHVLGTLDRAG